MTRVTARSRLHFGLIYGPPPSEAAARWPGLDGAAGLPVRHFGGVGLMLDEPSISVTAEVADGWSASGPNSARALDAARRCSAASDSPRPPLRIIVERCPPEHSGLGVGTALALAVARAVDRECAGAADYLELARRAGRGERSAVGVHGFHFGGLIVEGGKGPGEALSPLIAHHPLPEGWKVALHRPVGADRWFGDRERAAFRNLPTPAPAEIDRLCRLVVQGILPGIASADLNLFGEAVYEYNARIGDLFAPVQGGRYAGAGIAAKVAELRGRGAKCVGQSSWGPTVFEIG